MDTRHNRSAYKHLNVLSIHTIASSECVFIHPITGTEQCFLFTLLPQLSVYYASGLNKNFLYLNYGQETLPNGLVSKL